jgi:hypothetical protein
LLGNNEQRDAFGAGNGLAIGTWNFGQHQVNNVLRQVMLACGDPHLVALEAITRTQRVCLKIVTIGDGAGGHVTQRRARLRFAQAHGAGPAPREFIQGKHLLLQRAAMCHQQIGIANGQQATPNADGGAGKKGVGR